MNPKANRLMNLMEEGFSIGAAETMHDGRLRLEVIRGDDRETLEFAFYEVPAVLHAAQIEGTAA